jgi:hypothetical protein
MKIPHDWISEIINNLKNESMGIGSLLEYEKIIVDYWYNEFNIEWDIKQDPQVKEIFKQFFIRITTHQCNFSTHQLTCGVDSNHKFMVPRITEAGIPYLICPTCGYAQFKITGEYI